MDIKLKEINSQRIKTNIVILILQITIWIVVLSVTINAVSVKSICLTWLFSIYFLYANIWLSIILIFDLKNKVNDKNEIKLLFSGIGSIISIFSLIVWIILIREIYYEKKYNIDLLENVSVKDEIISSKGGIKYENRNFIFKESWKTT